jgi:hypothetical protein
MLLALNLQPTWRIEIHASERLFDQVVTEAKTLQEERHCYELTETGAVKKAGKILLPDP